jgi:hypothetical protein
MNVEHVKLELKMNNEIILGQAREIVRLNEKIEILNSFLILLPELSERMDSVDFRAVALKTSKEILDKSKDI